MEAVTQQHRNHTFISGGRSLDMPYSVLFNNRGLLEADANPVIYFPGYGESEQSTREVLQGAADQGVTAAALRLHFHDMPAGLADTAVASIERVGQELVPEAVSNIIPELGGDTVDAEANSMGAVVLGFLLRATRGDNHIDAITAINPMGLSNRSGRVSRNRATFLARYVGAMSRNNPFESGSFRAGRSAAAEIARDHRSRTFWAQLQVANTVDFAPEYVAHAATHHVDVTTGERDILFTSDAIEERIRDEIARQELEGSIDVADMVTRVQKFSHQDIGQQTALNVLAAARQNRINRS